MNEVSLKGSQVFTHEIFRKVSDLISSRKLSLEEIYEYGFNLKELEDIFIVADNKKLVKPKVIISFK